MNHPITKTILALGCAGTLATTAGAQLPTTYTEGDFLLGFREVGGSNSVVVDIGPIANLSEPETFAIDAGATLTTEYSTPAAGTTPAMPWQSNGNVYFSLASTDGSNDNTNYITSPQYLVGPNAGPAQIWSRSTGPASFTLKGKINNLGNEFTSAGEVESKTDTDAYQNFMPGGLTDAGHATQANIAWGLFNPTSEGNFSQTTAGVVLDLIELPPGSGPGTNVGDFAISSDGNTLTYTPNLPSGIPEPSSFVAMAVLGALAFFGFRVNKARKASTQARLA